MNIIIIMFLSIKNTKMFNFEVMIFELLFFIVPINNFNIMNKRKNKIIQNL